MFNRRNFLGGVAGVAGATAVAAAVPTESPLVLPLVGKPESAPIPAKIVQVWDENEDILFIHHPGTLSETAMVNLQDSFDKQLPGRKVIILEEGMHPEVVRMKKVRA